MQRRRCTFCESPYRRKRNNKSFLPVILILIAVLLFVCIMPVWALILTGGVIIGLAVGLIIGNR